MIQLQTRLHEPDGIRDCSSDEAGTGRTKYVHYRGVAGDVSAKWRRC